MCQFLGLKNHRQIFITHVTDEGFFYVLSIDHIGGVIVSMLASRRYRSWVRTPMTIKSIFVASPLGTHNLGTTSKNVKVQYGEMLDLSILFAVLNVRHEETASVSVLSSRCGRSCVRAPVGSNQSL